MGPDLVKLEAIADTSHDAPLSTGPFGLFAKATLPVFRVPEHVPDDLAEIVAVAFRDSAGIPVHGALIGVFADQSVGYPRAVRLSLVDTVNDVDTQRDPAHIAVGMVMSVGALQVEQCGAQRRMEWCIADFGMKDLNEPIRTSSAQIVARDAYLAWAERAPEVPVDLREGISRCRFRAGDLTESQSVRCAELVDGFGITGAAFQALREIRAKAPVGFMGSDWRQYGADDSQSEAIASLYGSGLSFKLVEHFLVARRRAAEAPLFADDAQVVDVPGVRG
jgi:hypothetical protein